MKVLSLWSLKTSYTGHGLSQYVTRSAISGHGAYGRWTKSTSNFSSSLQDATERGSRFLEVDPRPKWVHHESPKLSLAKQIQRA